MDDFPTREPPRFWIAFSILCAAFALAFIMLVYSSIRAEAQEQAPICAPLSHLVPAWEEVHKEKIVWEGVMPTPQGPLEFVLFQSDKGGWSLFVVQGGIACLRAGGRTERQSTTRVFECPPLL